MKHLMLAEVANYLGVSPAWIDKIWIVFEKPIPGVPGQKRYFTQREADLLKTTRMLRVSGLSLEVIGKLYKTYVVEDAWDIKRLCKDEPVVKLNFECLLQDTKDILKLVES